MGRDARNNGSPFKRAAAMERAGQILDQLGRPLNVGDMVMFGNSPNVFYRVADIQTPTNVDPRKPLPAGAKILILAAGWVNPVPSGQPLSGLIKIDAAEEMEAAQGPQLVVPPEAMQ